MPPLKDDTTHRQAGQTEDLRCTLAAERRGAYAYGAEDGSESSGVILQPLLQDSSFRH